MLGAIAYSSVDTVGVVEAASSVQITKEDLTGDGSDDIRLENSNLVVQINGEDLERDSDINATSTGGHHGEGNITNGIVSAPLNPSGSQVEFVNTTAFEVVKDSLSVGSYRIVREYTLDGVPVEATWEVTLHEGDEFILTELTIENIGGTSVTLDHPSSHVHDGVQLFRNAELVGRTGHDEDYRFHLPGHGTRTFGDTRFWRTFSGTDWGTLFDNQDAVTYGLIEGSTSPRMWITNPGSSPPRVLDYLVEEKILRTRELISYTGFVGIHDGGSNAPTAGQQIYDDATARAAGKPPGTPDNTPPSAAFTFSPEESVEGKEITLDSSGSDDTDGTITTFEWDFDDDGIFEKIGEQVTHTFTESGDFPVTLRVTDDDGATDETTKTVSVISFEVYIANRYAPNLHFGEHEKWFPTDPRELPLTIQNDRLVLDGFNALNAYTAEMKSTDGSPPWLTVFYDFTVAGGKEDDPIEDRPLIVISYWFYYVFNQFLNSHMHDWSVLHIFIDNRDSSPEPVLLVGRAHGPGKALLGLENNEYFRPKREYVDSEIGRPAGVLEEVGAHASATDINDAQRTFEPAGNAPDITNNGAYGLPREEIIIPLPYLMPRINVAPGVSIPLYQHDGLPDVTRSDLIEELTLRSPTGLEIPGFCKWFVEPPSDHLPFRTHGKTLVNRSNEVNGDHEYKLDSLGDLESEIEELSGEKLEQNVCLPFLIDDITFTKNFEPSKLQTSDYDPFQDITDSTHRREFAASFDFLTLEDRNVSIVEGEVFETRPGAEGEIKEEFSDIKQEFADLIGFSLLSVSFESMVMLESDDIVLSTANGRFSIQAAPDEHRLIINGPGYAPYAETFDLGDTGYQAGGVGKVSLVPNKESVKIGGELPNEKAKIQRIQIANDFVGEMYDSKPPVEENAFAVYVPRTGSYTVEITDIEGKSGAFRVDPGPEEDIVTIDIKTGKAPLAVYLSDFLSDIAEMTHDTVGHNGLAKALAKKFEAAAASASRAAGHAQKDRAQQADNQLRTARKQINAALNQIDAQRGNKLSEASAVLLTDLARRAEAKAEETADSSL